MEKLILVFLSIKLKIGLKISKSYTTYIKE